jgi:hypothetical protein
MNNVGVIARDQPRMTTLMSQARRIADDAAGGPA